MASIKVVLRTNKQKKDGTCPLAIRITKDRKPSFLFTGYYVSITQWDKEAQIVKKNHPNSKRLNNLLRKKLSEASDKALEAETREDLVSSQDIKTKIKRKGKSIPFFEYGARRVENKFLSKVYSVAKSERSILNNIDEFINLREGEGIESVKVAINQRRLDRISKSRRAGYSFIEDVKVLGKKNSNLSFEDINESFLNQYRVFCSAYLDMKSRTITNQLIFIRTIFNAAITEGLVEKKYYPFECEAGKLRIGSGNKIGLEREEVQRIETLELEPDTQIWHTRNVWLFSFYFAGVRISDVLTMKWSDFKSGRLYYQMDKNEKPVSLKIPDKAKVILDHYKGRRKDKQFVFPHLDQANAENDFDVFVKVRNATTLLNDYLKKIAKACKIDKVLSNHIARHTFGNLAGDSVHPLMLQKLYRHSDLKTTVNYQANFINKEADAALDSVIG